MKWAKFSTPQTETTFKEGDWNVIDDRFGHKVKASETTKQWDGMRSIGSQQRHPQDFIRAKPERIGTPWSRPETLTYVNQGAVLLNGDFLTDTDWTKGASWAIANGVATYTAGSTDTLYQDISAISGKIYEVEFTVFKYVGTGSVTVSIGTASGTARTTNGTYIEKITSAGSNASRLTLTPASGATSFNIDFVRVLRVG